jgi:hypothetical protein
MHVKKLKQQLNMDDDLSIDLSDIEIGDIDLSSSYYPSSTITIDSSHGAGGSTIIGGGAGMPSYAYASASSTVASSWATDFDSTSSGTVTVPADGDIKIGDRSLKEFMTKMEERLAILVPDPEKLERFESLKRAYEHYKTMERLCQIEEQDKK